MGEKWAIGRIYGYLKLHPDGTVTEEGCDRFKGKGLLSEEQDLLRVLRRLLVAREAA